MTIECSIKKIQVFEKNILTSPSEQSNYFFLHAGFFDRVFAILYWIISKAFQHFFSFVVGISFARKIFHI